MAYLELLCVLKRKLRKFSNLRLLEFDLDLDVTDVDDTLLRHSGGSKLFDQVTMPDLMADLEAAGILPDLRARGYSDLNPCIERPDPYQEKLRIFAHHPRCGEQPVVLMEMQNHRGELTLPGMEPQLALVWDWVHLQDPASPFSAKRPALPGQDHPGLGLFRLMTGLMLRYVQASEVQAVVAVPEYYHNAVLYNPEFHFADPAHEGWFRALQRDLRHLSLDQASFAIEHGQVWEADGKAVAWLPAEQVYPVRSPVVEFFKSDSYKNLVEERQKSLAFRKN